MHWASVEAARSCDGTVVPGSRVPASVLTEANGPRGWQVPRKPNYGGQMRSHAPVPGGLRWVTTCLLYTSDAADDLLCVDLGGRRNIKKKRKKKKSTH